MKKLYIFFASLILSCPAYGQKSELTVEEKVIMNSFQMYMEGMVYDEICNGTDPSTLYDPDTDHGVLLFGNMQMLAARTGGLWHVRHPQRSVEEGVAYLVAVQKRIQDSMRNIIKDKGCNSEEAIDAARSYGLYSQNHPAIIYNFIDETIIKGGGRVTTADEIEAAGTPPTKE